MKNHIALTGEASDHKVAGMVDAATDLQDEGLQPSSWGPQVDLAAPGVDVPGYRFGDSVVGEDAGYVRATGTSFAAPIVAGIASLMLRRKPELSPSQLRRILAGSARDIGPPVVDSLTGNGMVDARAALQSSPASHLEVRIDGVAVVLKDGRAHVRVLGTAAADRWISAQENSRRRGRPWHRPRTRPGLPAPLRTCRRKRSADPLYGRFVSWSNMQAVVSARPATG